MSAQKLAGRARRYCFISTVSVYKNWPEEACDESGALATLEDESIEEITGETYGALKVLCEREAEAAFPGAALIVRPGLIVGPNDPTDRFAYWPHRVAQGGRASRARRPGHPDAVHRCPRPGGVDDPSAGARGHGHLQRRWPECRSGRAAPHERGGFGNGAERHLCLRSLSSGERSGPWSELPLWIPGMAEKPNGGATDCRRAVSAGLTIAPYPKPLPTRSPGTPIGRKRTPGKTRSSLRKKPHFFRSGDRKLNIRLIEF